MVASMVATRHLCSVEHTDIIVTCKLALYLPVAFYSALLYRFNWHVMLAQYSNSLKHTHVCLCDACWGFACTLPAQWLL
jgi:hypothetical protein